MKTRGLLLIVGGGGGEGGDWVCRAGFGDRVVVALGLAGDGVEMLGMLGMLIDVAASLRRVRGAVEGGCIWVNSTRSTALY